MEKEIDFLRAYQKKTEPTRNIFHFLTQGLILVTVVYCIFLGGIIAYWGFLNRSLGEINRKIELKEERIKQQEKKESLYFLLKNQLSSLSQVFSEVSQDYSQILSFLFQIGGDKIEISEIKISPNGETNISASARNAFFMASFLDELVNNKQTGGFSKITLDSLSGQKEKGYSFSMSFYYDKD